MKMLVLSVSRDKDGKARGVWVEGGDYIGLAGYKGEQPEPGYRAEWDDEGNLVFRR